MHLFSFNFSAWLIWKMGTVPNAAWTYRGKRRTYSYSWRAYTGPSFCFFVCSFLLQHCFCRLHSSGGGIVTSRLLAGWRGRQSLASNLTHSESTQRRIDCSVSQVGKLRTPLGKEYTHNSARATEAHGFSSHTYRLWQDCLGLHWYVKCHW